MTRIKNPKFSYKYICGNADCDQPLYEKNRISVTYKNGKPTNIKYKCSHCGTISYGKIKRDPLKIKKIKALPPAIRQMAGGKPFYFLTKKELTPLSTPPTNAEGC